MLVESLGSDRLSVKMNSWFQILSVAVLMTIPSLSDGGRVCGTKWTQSHQFLTQTNMLFQLMMNHHAVMQLRMMKNNELLMKPLKRRPN